MDKKVSKLSIIALLILLVSAFVFIKVGLAASWLVTQFISLSIKKLSDLYVQWSTGHAHSQAVTVAFESWSRCSGNGT